MLPLSQKCKDGHMKFKTPKIKHIGIRITVYFTLLVLMIGVSISVLISMVFSGEVIKQINNVVDQKMGLITSILDKNVDEIKSLHFKIIADDTLQYSFIPWGCNQ